MRKFIIHNYIKPIQKKQKTVLRVAASNFNNQPPKYNNNTNILLSAAPKSNNHGSADNTIYAHQGSPFTPPSPMTENVNQYKRIPLSEPFRSSL